MQPTVRPATARDLPAVVALFADPVDGNEADRRPVTEPSSAPAELDPRYEAALASMMGDPDNALFVAEVDGAVVGTFQRTIIQHVAYKGGKVSQIENVMVDPRARGEGVGAAMMTWAVEEARRRGCYRVQLTSNKARTRAHRFYERLGFVRTHEGFKRIL